MMRHHIVALSGGKDSTCLALLLRETYPDTDYTYICTPTGRELPEMICHWKRLSDLLGRPILPVMARTTLTGLVREQQALPNFRQRWCTRLSKIEPSARWLAAHAPAVYYVGLRADEPLRMGGVYDDVPGIEVCFPLREHGFGLGDVLRFLAVRGVEIPARTDCDVCFFQRLDEWYALWRDYPDRWAEGEAMERETGHTFRTRGRDSWPVAMRDLRAAFEAGRMPARAQPSLFSQARCRACNL